MINPTNLAALLLIVHGNVMADTDIEFAGTLVAEPCMVETGNELQTIDMGTIAAKTFINHTQSGPQAFNIRLQDCDLSLGTDVAVTFTGREDSQQPGTFAVTGDASGISIALENGSGTKIEPNTALPVVKLAAGDNQLNYVAYVQGRDVGKVKEGPFESRVIFSLEYQ